MTDQTNRPSLAAVASRAAQTETVPIRTSRAGRIVSFDPTADPPTADVQLVHDEVTIDTAGQVQTSAAPIVRGKPVLFPGGAGVSLTWGLSEGDPVLVLFRDVSHDEYDHGRTGGTYAPQDPRRWAVSDAIVLPIARFAPREDGAPTLVIPDGEVFRVGATDSDEPVGMASALREELDAIWSAIYGGHAHAAGTLLDGMGSPVTGATATATGTPDTRDIASNRLRTDDTITPGVGVT